MKNCFVKSAVIVLLALFSAYSAPARSSCDLKSIAAPLLLNLQTGISPEQAQAILGRAVKIKIKKTGERTFFQNFIKKPAPASLRGVRALYLRFFDRALYQIEIFYEPQSNFRSLDDIAAGLSSQFNLSDSDWTIENNRARAICGEISLIADNVLNPRVELTDETTRSRVEEKRKREADKK